jgi:hypothetical protein
LTGITNRRRDGYDRITNGKWPLNNRQAPMLPAQEESKERVDKRQNGRPLSEEYEQAQQQQYDDDRRQPPPFGLFQEQEQFLKNTQS